MTKKCHIHRPLPIFEAMIYSKENYSDIWMIICKFKTMNLAGRGYTQLIMCNKTQHKEHRKLFSSSSVEGWAQKFGLTVLSGHSKIDKTKILMTNGSLMKVKCIAECSPWSILQYFLPALSDNRS